MSISGHFPCRPIQNTPHS